MAVLKFAFSLAFLFAVGAAVDIKMPTTYHVKGNIYLPRAGVAEPYEAWVDQSRGVSRIDYYGGVAQVINRGDQGGNGAIYKIVFETTQDYLNKRTCFTASGMADAKVTYQGVFPDMTNYKDSGSTATFQGIECAVYYYSYEEGSKNNEYTMLVDKASNRPVVLHFVGYDNVFGSHFDEYDINYDMVNTTVDDGVFDIYKDMSCGAFPGPGLAHVMHANPAFELVGSPEHDRSLQTAHLDKQFNDFKEKHKKSYHDDVEHAKRKTVFLHNLRYIDSNNRKALTYSLAVNHMADLSDEELHSMRGYRPSKGDKGGLTFSGDVTDAPPTWDWRIQGAVTYIKDQGICGSCWSFGTTGTIEGAYFIKHKKQIRLSEQVLVDCSWGYGNIGCDGGETFRAYKWIMDNKCLPTEDSYGQYLQQDGYCHASAGVCGAIVTNYTKIPSGDLSALRTAIYTHGPVAVAIDASHKSFTFYGFGIYYEEQCGNKEEDLDHSVLAIGYGTLDGQDYWLVKNSWSELWGNEGFVTMAQKDNNCGVATDADFADVE